MNKSELHRLYISEHKSAAEIAVMLGCSTTKVNYWIAKFDIPKRSISESIYVKSNPEGDPFSFKHPKISKESFLFGLGLGLFWGEGNKRNKNSVRLGNSDPKLIKMFVQFLVEVFKVKKEKIRFGLQVFNDVNSKNALGFWVKYLGFPKSAFLPTVVVSEIRGAGTYKAKSQHGVLTIYFNNTKLRNILTGLIENIEQIR